MVGRTSCPRQISRLNCIAALFLILATFYCPGSAAALDYPPNFKFVAVPDPLSGDNPRYPLLAMSAPLAGQPFYDLRFGTVLTRVTQTNMRHEYSRFDPFNHSRTLLLLLDPSSGEWRVYQSKAMPYDQPGNLVRTINNLAEPRWDRAAASLLWGLRDFSIVTLDVLTGQEVVIKHFSKDATLGPILKAEPDLYRVTTKDEGEASLDRRYWALGLQGSRDDYRLRYIFCWDRQQDKVLGLYQLPLVEGQALDWVGMSPLGNWVLIGGEPAGSWSAGGLILANKELTTFHPLAYATAHSDVGLDPDGQEVLVMQNNRTDYIDLIPLDLTSRVVKEVSDYANNAVIPLVRLYYANSPIGLKSGVHLSCNYPGYCLISTNTEPQLPEQNWLDRSIILVRLDRQHPRACYLAKVYNTTGQYWEETQASISNDGARVVWADNWGQSVPEGQTPKTFLMQLDLPPGWQQLTAAPALIPYSLLLGDGG
jgi:hypothetical protein